MKRETKRERVWSRIGATFLRLGFSISLMLMLDQLGLKSERSSIYTKMDYIGTRMESHMTNHMHMHNRYRCITQRSILHLHLR